jgi:hypothetical protein
VAPYAATSRGPGMVMRTYSLSTGAAQTRYSDAHAAARIPATRELSGKRWITVR